MTDGTPQDIDAKMPMATEEALMHADMNRSDTIARFEGDGDASAHARTSQERMSASAYGLSTTSARSTRSHRPPIPA